MQRRIPLSDSTLNSKFLKVLSRKYPKISNSFVVPNSLQNAKVDIDQLLYIQPDSLTGKQNGGVPLMKNFDFAFKSILSNLQKNSKTITNKVLPGYLLKSVTLFGPIFSSNGSKQVNKKSGNSSFALTWSIYD